MKMKDLTEGNKEYALNDFERELPKMWAYKEMTPMQQTKMHRLLKTAKQDGAIAGTYKTRYMICLSIYHAYVAGLRNGKES